MNENEFILQDRLGVIRDTIHKYGEDNFYISFSGGKDSTVVHHLVDMALPGNKIPRVFSNTGIEYNAIVEFVREREREDGRFVMIQPTKNIKKTLEEEGYPFKSKMHSHFVEIFNRRGKMQGVKAYIGEADYKLLDPCPKKLLYQFDENYKMPFKISDHCCLRMKEDPIEKWRKANKKPYGINGLMREEGGRRKTAECTVFKQGKLRFFQPLAKITHEWEEWFIKEYDIKLCKLYYEPYNFERTGCKGCPFALDLQTNLETLSKYLPNERKQCEYIWKPVYDEYRRLGYRLKREEQTKLF